MKTKLRATLEQALGQPADSDERWEAIHTLRTQTSDDGFKAAVALFESTDVAHRVFGAQILAQYGAGDRPGHSVRDGPYAQRLCDLLVPALKSERDPAVLRELVTAMGFLRPPAAVAQLHALRVHRDDDVRQSVAFSLGGWDEDLAIEALIDLTWDAHSHTRDWATFGLGLLSERDDPAVREALVCRLDDDDEDTRLEAIRGLGLRGDVRAIPALLAEYERVDELEDFSCLVDGLLALAAQTADPRLRDRVIQLSTDWQRDVPDEELPEELQAAIDAYG